jgi:hypothetical protein
VLRQQGDVHDADLVGPSGDVEASDRLAVPQDDLEPRAGVVLLVVGVLGLELLPEEAAFSAGVQGTGRSSSSRVLA